jgi:hypothetical protein
MALFKQLFCGEICTRGFKRLVANARVFRRDDPNQIRHTEGISTGEIIMNSLFFRRERNIKFHQKVFGSV